MYRIKSDLSSAAFLVSKWNNTMYGYWWKPTPPPLFLMRMPCMKINNVELYMLQVCCSYSLNYSYPLLLSFCLNVCFPDLLKWMCWAGYVVWVLLLMVVQQMLISIHSLLWLGSINQSIREGIYFLICFS